MEFQEPMMRPPQEAHSVLLRATQGCTYNQCYFCYVSRDYPFRAVSKEAFEHSLLQQGMMTINTPIYLTGSNPFILPTSKLQEYLSLLNHHAPQHGRISMQARVDDIATKTMPELVSLYNAGLTHLYIGVENGNEATLRLMNKGHSAAETVTQLLRLDEAGITYTTYYVLGLGGHGMATLCGQDTAKMFNKIHPQRITTTGMTIFANTPLAKMLATGLYVQATEREKIEELQVFLQLLEIDTFYDGIHYLNPLNYRFANQDSVEKAKVLADIQEVLETYSDDELELMVNRPLMQSL